MRSSALFVALVATLSASASAGILPRQNAASSVAGVASGATAAASSVVATASGAASSAAPSTDAASSSEASSASDSSAPASSATAAANSTASVGPAPTITASAPATASDVPALPPYGAMNYSSYANSSVAGPNGLDNADCRNITLQVPVQAENVRFSGVDNTYSNQSYITGQILELANFQQDWFQSRANGTQPNNQTYTIQSTYCTPKKGGSQNGSLIVGVHGIGFNRRYWDFRPNGTNEYSFVRQATSYGYSVFTYDRLGTGQSSHPDDGFSQVQVATEVSVLANVLEQLRNGTAVQGRKFESIVGVGHSYGSIQLQALTAAAPDLLKAVALTGYSNTSSGITQFLLAGNLEPAKQVSPQKFNNVSDVYLLSGTSASDITLFLWPPNFDADAAAIARADYGDAVTLGTLASLATATKPAADFDGKVFVISGEHDLPFCQGNCQPPLLDGVKDGLYPKAGNFSSYIVPQSGHGLVVGYTGPDSNRRVVQFFIDNQV
ncbi:unnamed protein product [Parajaminaea phylloscopi]